MTVRAFTLIELLVVITIIVVLLALLTPALDKAIYQAELAVCAASLKGVASGVQAYAIGSSRSYPVRGAVRAGDYRRPNLLKWGGTTQADDRLPLMDYMSLEQLLDPLNGRGVIDIDPGEASAESHIYANYAMWWDWSYEIPGGGARLSRLGQRFGWQGDRYSVLASDLVLDWSACCSFLSHPDKDGLLSQTVAQDTDYTGAGGLGGLAGGVYTLSRWEGGWERGVLDMNSAYQDGSVDRIVDVGAESYHPDEGELTAALPETTNANTHPTYYVQVPRR